jgi:DNA-binding transcriptional LysR family regulator
MNEIDRLDHADLDGHLLQLLLAVAEERSVTRAAQRLGLTQSAVSHGLERLRAIVGDALFVRSGRGIVATARAEALVPRARLLLDELRRFVTAEGFEPERYRGILTIAANDLQRDLLLPALLRRLRREAPGLTLRVIPSGVPTPEMLRDGDCQLVISPRPPEAGDLVHKRLFDDRYVVFYDPAQRAAPTTIDDYLAADHVTVVYEPRRALDLDRAFADRGVSRRIVASVPGFAGVPAFLRGSDALGTAPSLLREGVMRGLAWCNPPLPCPALPMYLIWHARDQADPMHRWVRSAIERCAAEAIEPGST